MAVNHGINLRRCRSSACASATMFAAIGVIGVEFSGRAVASRAFACLSSRSGSSPTTTGLRVANIVRQPAQPSAALASGASAVAVCAIAALAGSSRRRNVRALRCAFDDLGSTPLDLDAAEFEEEASGPQDKTIQSMTKFSNQYAKISGTYFCTDLSVASVVVIGLAVHKETLGSPLCPCRHYEDKEREVKQGYWNCPCVPMRERNECHCMLFLEDSNPFCGDQQTLDLEDIIKMKDQC